MSDAPRIVPLGEAAATIVLGDRVDDAINRRATALAARIRAAGLDGVQDTVAAWATVSVYYDPLHLDFDALQARLAAIAAEPDADVRVDEAREHRIPVHYDGPDLGAVARAAGLPEAEVIARHARQAYRVHLLGFVPGFAYLGPLDPSLAIPRRSTPRTRVPAGAVAIAGAQTAIYPLPTPGGWHLIGHTDLRPFDPDREPAALFAPGDTVRFVPVP